MITLFRRFSKRALTQSARPGTQADIRIAGISLISRIKLEGVPHADAAQISALCTGFENTLAEDDRKAFLEHLAVALNRLDITLALLPQPHDKASARVACLLTLSVFLSTFALSFTHVSARCCIQRLLGMTLRFTTSGAPPITCMRSTPVFRNFHRRLAPCLALLLRPQASDAPHPRINAGRHHATARRCGALASPKRKSLSG